MKAAASNSRITESHLAVPCQIVLVAALLGVAIAAVLVGAGQTAPAVIFLGLAVAFGVVGRSRRG
jgi:hypothetical protein